MIKFTAEQIQDRFEQLPKEVQDAVTSAEVRENIVAVSKKHGLHIDQEGELVDQIGLIMLGLSPSKDFVRNFSSAAEIDTKTATAVAEDINTEIFDKIKSSMRKIESSEMSEQAKNTQSQSDIERIGGFTIENDKENQNSVHESKPIETHEEILAHIENPGNMAGSDHTESMLVDHFLSGPTVSVEKKIEQVAPEASIMDDEPVPVKPKPPKGPDQYREPVA